MSQTRSFLHVSGVRTRKGGVLSPLISSCSHLPLPFFGFPCFLLGIIFRSLLVGFLVLSWWHDSEHLQLKNQEPWHQKREDCDVTVRGNVI